MSDVSAVTNHFSTAHEGFLTTLGSSILSGAATVPLTSTSGLTNGNIFVGIIEPGLTREQTFTGVIDTGGSQITGVKWTRGTNADHSAGVTIVDYVTGTGHNMLTKGMLVAHNQDGTHKTSLVLVTPKVDSIGENTAAAGVTVDSLLIKDGTPIYDGWMIGNDTWTYASATTFTIAGVDRTARFPVGTKLKLSQTGTKYFYVVSSAFSTNTTITVTGGSDYSLANAAITSPFYSYMSSPQGWPVWFNYTPTVANFTTGNGTITGMFKLTDQEVFGYTTITLGSTSSVTGALTVSVPITGNTMYSTLGPWPLGWMWMEDFGVSNYQALIRFATSNTLMTLSVLGTASTYLSPSGAVDATHPFTWGTDDRITAEWRYRL